MLATPGFLLYLLTSTVASAVSKRGPKMVLSNDDGWAVAQIRAEFTAFREQGYEVVLSAPAENKSGTGSSTAEPTVLSIPCEFDTCPVGSPPTGFNASDPSLNYVNAFPVDSVRFGIQALAPKLLGGKPDFAVCGTNIGNNLGPIVLISGTVGAACEAAMEGVPSVAFSGASGDQVSYTTLESSPYANTTITAHIYTTLTTNFMRVLLDNPGPILPPNVSINVNYPASQSSSCPSASRFKFVLTRINPDPNVTDVHTCGSGHLPDETSAIATEGCFATVSVFNATNKADVPAATQEFVLKKLKKILTCLPANHTENHHDEY